MFLQQQQQQQHKKQNLSSKHSIYPNCPAPKTEKQKNTSTGKQNLTLAYHSIFDK
jgi:hypothetical protein